MKRREGFSVVEVILIFVVVVIVGAVGWLAYANIISPKSSTETSQDSASSKDTVTVDDEQGLDIVEESLDTLSLDDTESSELDSAIGSF
jgi:cytoskeletal protein RodZ